MSKTFERLCDVTEEFHRLDCLNQINESEYQWALSPSAKRKLIATGMIVVLACVIRPAMDLVHYLRYERPLLVQIDDKTDEITSLIDDNKETLNVDAGRIDKKTKYQDLQSQLENASDNCKQWIKTGDLEARTHDCLEQLNAINKTAQTSISSLKTYKENKAIVDAGVNEVIDKMNAIMNVVSSNDQINLALKNELKARYGEQGFVRQDAKSFGVRLLTNGGSATLIQQKMDAFKADRLKSLDEQLQQIQKNNEPTTAPVARQQPINASEIEALVKHYSENKKAYGEQLRTLRTRLNADDISLSDRDRIVSQLKPFPFINSNQVELIAIATQDLINPNSFDEVVKRFRDECSEPKMCQDSTKRLMAQQGLNNLKQFVQASDDALMNIQNIIGSVNTTPRNENTQSALKILINQDFRGVFNQYDKAITNMNLCVQNKPISERKSVVEQAQKIQLTEAELNFKPIQRQCIDSETCEQSIRQVNMLIDKTKRITEQFKHLCQ